MVIASLQKLTKTYGKPGTHVCVHALRGIDLDFIEAESIAICGQSGSGKSTMLNLLGCLDRPTSGRYLLAGTDVAGLDDDGLSEVRGKRIGFVFQSFNLIAQLTVVENVEIPLYYQGVPARTRRQRAEHVIDLVGLGDRMHHRPSELSGGQQQRAAIARSLINDPLIILADEPTGNLDSATGDQIFAVFDDLQRRGKTIILVTHDPNAARRCDRIITLRDGRLLEDTRDHKPRQQATGNGQ